MCCGPLCCKFFTLGLLRLRGLNAWLPMDRQSRPCQPSRRRGVLATPSRSSDRLTARRCGWAEPISHRPMINGRRRSARCSAHSKHRPLPGAVMPGTMPPSGPNPPGHSPLSRRNSPGSPLPPSYGKTLLPNSYNCTNNNIFSLWLHCTMFKSRS